MISKPLAPGSSAPLGVPVLPACVPGRPRLRQRFDEALQQGSLILIRSTKGTGKTTAAADWAAHAQEPVTWVNVDGEPGTAQQMWFRILRASSERTFAGTPLESIVAAAAAAVLSSDGPRESLLPAVSAVGSHIMVLDGYLPGPDGSFLKELVTVLAMAPAVKAILILTGDLPSEQVALLRQVEYAIIGNDDLHMTLEEVVNQIAVCGSDLDPSHVHTCTTGFALLVRLALTEHKIRPFNGLEDVARFVSFWIRTSIFKHLPGAAENRAFLLATSTAESLTPELARKLTGREDAGELLSRFESVRLIQREGLDLFRYSPAIRSALQDELAASDSEALPTLRRIVIEDLEQSGRVIEALRMAVGAGDYTVAENVLARNLTSLFFIQDSADGAAGILDAVPESIMLRHPVIPMTLGLILARTAYGRNRGVRLLGTALAGREAGRSKSTNEARTLSPLVEMVGLRAAGRFREAVRRAPKVAEIFESGTLDSRSAVSGASVFAYYQGALTLLLEGWGVGARAMIRSALSEPDRIRPKEAQLACLGLLAFSYGMDGRVFEADETLIQADELYTEPQGDCRFFAAYIMAKGFSCLEHGDPERALRILARRETMLSSSELWAYAASLRAAATLMQNPALVDTDELERAAAGQGPYPLPSHALALVTSTLSTCHLALGNTARASAALQWLNYDEAAKLSKVRIHLASGDFAAAGSVLARLKPVPSEPERLTVTRLVMTSAVHAQAGLEAEAERELNQALAILRRSGMGTSMLMIPEPARKFLPPHQLLEAANGVPAYAIPAVPDTAQLTAREQVVLKTLASSDTAAAAARTLGVSLNTIKAQSRSIYRKLGVGTLNDAISEARRISIL